MSTESITIYARDLPVLIEGDKAKSGVDEDKLCTIFGQYANVDPISVDVKTSQNLNGLPLSYAIIKLSSQEDARRLMSKINHRTIKKVPIHLVFFDDEAQKVLKNNDGHALVIHDLNASVQPQDLHEMFSKFGDVIDCEIPLGSDNVAYVLFRKLDDARCAVKKMNGSAPTGAVPIQVDVDDSEFFTKLFVLPDKNVDLVKENERLRNENKELKEKLIVYEKNDAN